MRLLIAILLLSYSYVYAQEFSLSGVGLINPAFKAQAGILAQMESDIFTAEVLAVSAVEDHEIQTKIGVDFVGINQVEVDLFPVFYRSRFDNDFDWDHILSSQIRIKHQYKNIGFQASLMYDYGQDFMLQGGISYKFLTSSSSQEYVFSKKQVAGLALLFFGGYIHGWREYYHKDPRVFEKIFGFSETSWFGSRSWERKYDENGNEVRWRTPISDFWHFGEIVSKGAIIGGTYFVLSDKTNCNIYGKKNWKEVGRDLAFSFVSSSIGAWIGYGSANLLSND